MILDLIALIIVGYCVYMGVKKGFVKAFFGTTTLILAMVLTMLTVNPAVNYIKSTPIADTVYENTHIDMLSEEDVDKMLEFAEKFIETEEIKEANSGVESIQEDISLYIGDAVIKSLCSVVLFIVYSVALKIAVRFVDAVFKLPILSTFNKAGGLLTGVINAYIMVLIFTCIIMMLMSTSMNGFITSQLEGSYITSWIYKTNPLL